MSRLKPLFICLLLGLSLVACVGCKDKEEKLIFVGSLNDAPAISAIPAQNATEGTPFNLDLTPYVTDDHDAVADLTFAVISGGGSFTGALYSNTFTTTGLVTVQFWVQDTEGMVSGGSFDVSVAPMVNNAPVVANILDQNATVNYTFILDVAGHVSDDHDADKDLSYAVTSGGGSFIGTVYAHTFTTTGLQPVGFSVTDSGSLNATGTFNVDVQDPAPTNQPPVINNIDAQNATELQTFNLDLTPYVSDDNDAIGQLTFAVISGGGSFGSPVYSNIFDTTGLQTIEFIVMDTEGASATGLFDVTVAELTNDPPVISTIDDQTALLDEVFALDLSGYVSDDLDTDEQLTFSVTSGGGSFTGAVYLNSFSTEATFTINFDVQDTRGAISSSSFDVGAYSSPVAEFSVDIVTGTAPLVVQFTDESTGTVGTWEWDFDNDSSIDSTAQNPTHSYDSPGSYTVNLTITGPGGDDTEVKTELITVIPVSPIADFAASPTQGISPLLVNFTDLSTGDIDTWSWDFGDGIGTSTVQDPAYTYTTTGWFTVTLTVSGPGGIDTLPKASFIQIVVAPSDILYVDGSVTFTTGDGSSWANAFQVIQSGIGAATDYQIVLVADGYYSGTSNVDLDFGGRLIHCRDTTFTAAACALLTAKTTHVHLSSRAEKPVMRSLTVSQSNTAIVQATAAVSPATTCSSPTIVNCTFSGCYADANGGAIYCGLDCNVTIDNCTFSNNTIPAASYGGAIYCFNCAPTVTTCDFRYNKAPYGAAISIDTDAGPATITGCTFTDNTASIYGGAVILTGNSIAMLTNCTLSDNTANNNGGAVYTDNSDATIVNCVMEENSAANEGGAIYGNTTNATLLNCTITGNSAQSQGAGICYFSSAFNIATCNFDRNITYGWGGGVYLEQATLTMSNSSITNSLVLDGGGGIFAYDTCIVSLDNCIIDGNRSTMFGGYGFMGGGIICGESELTLINTTITNNQIEFGGGLYAEATNATMVNCNISDNTAAYEGGNIFFSDNTLNITGCTVSGGIAEWAGGMCVYNNAVLNMSNCTVSHNQALDAGGLDFEGSDATITGSTVTGNTVIGGYGAGIYTNTASCVITNCTVSENWAMSATGGGIYCSGNIILSGCSILNNWAATSTGGGICIQGNSVTISDCTIADNKAGSHGGGIYITGGNPEIYNCSITGNSASGDGCGLYCRRPLVLAGCLVADNYSTGSASRGGGIYLNTSTHNIVNSTVVYNSACNGGGIYLDLTAPAVIFANSILWGNTASNLGPQAYISNTAQLDASYSDIQDKSGSGIYVEGGGNYNEGTGVIDSDPLFINLALKNYRINSAPCIDVGNNTAANGVGLTTDLDNNPRIVNATVDIGAYEKQ